MNKIFFAIVLNVAFFSWTNAQNAKHIILTGAAPNSNAEYFAIYNEEDTVFVDIQSDRTFADTMTLMDGYHSLNLGENTYELFLKQGFELEINLGDTLRYSGNGALENNYLVAQSDLGWSLQKFHDYKYCENLDENAFVLLMDSLLTVREQLLLPNEKDFDQEFFYIEHNKVKYLYMHEKAMYDTSKRFATQNLDFKASESYYTTLFNDFDVNNGRLAKVRDYIYTIHSYLYQKSEQEIDKSGTDDRYLAILRILNQEITDPTVREEASYYMVSYNLDRTDELDSMYKLLKPNLTNDRYIQELETKYKRLKKIAKGSQSPSFELIDVHGKLVKLDDLRGRFVYIDIWSTTCSPCLSEIPYLEKMIEQTNGKDIYWVSINIIDSEAHWKKTVQEKSLKGIKLHTENTKLPFFKDYMVQGIPRFILLDPTGRILDSSAPRPSDPKLSNLLDSLLTVMTQ
jgi:thiol-disulfide isomerase/thioredoxin